MTTQKRNIYKTYLIKYKEKLTLLSTNIFSKSFINIFLNDFTFNLIKRKYFCPRCESVITKFDFDNHPIYTYGCYKCRELKEIKWKLNH